MNVFSNTLIIILLLVNWYTDQAIYRWFNTAVRPKYPEEYYRTYKYDITTIPNEFQPTTSAIASNIKVEYNLSLQASFYNISNMYISTFLWWFEEITGLWNRKEVTIGELVFIEFDMYLWHFRPSIGNSGNFDWF